MNAGMAMVRNLVPLDIMIYGVEVGNSDAWTLAVVLMSRGNCMAVDVSPPCDSAFCLHFQLQSASILSLHYNRGSRRGSSNILPETYTRFPGWPYFTNLPLMSYWSLPWRYFIYVRARPLIYSSLVYWLCIRIYLVHTHLTVYTMLSLGRLIARQALPRQTQPILTTPGNAVMRYSNPFSTSSIRASQRTKYINALIQDNGPGTSFPTVFGDWRDVDYKSIEIDTALLLETLRNMQSYRRLTPNDSSTSKLKREVPASMRGVANSRITRVSECFAGSLPNIRSRWWSF